MKSESRLFRSPTSIGLLCGGLAGAVGIASTVIEAHLQTPLDGFNLLWNVTAVATLLLQFILPALLAGRRADVIVPLLLQLVAFYFVGFALPLNLLVDGVGFLGNHIQLYWLAWSVLYSLATGLFLAHTLRRIHRREDIRFAAYRWGALSSSFNVVLQFAFTYVYVYLEDTSENWWAAIAMATALGQVVQGVVAAVPFEREKVEVKV